MMKLLAGFPLVITVLAALLTSHSVMAGTLYQWQAADGTPTYSPDPPAKGIAYTVVGSDLKPIPGATPSAPTSVAPSAATNELNDETAAALAAFAGKATVIKPKTQTAAKPDTQPGFSRPSKLVIAPTPEGSKQKPIKQSTPWKPVIYADDPNPIDSARPITDQSNSVSTAPTTSTASSHCLAVKQRLRVLEGQFANAQTPDDMDQAVLSLSAFKNENKGQCGL